MKLIAGSILAGFGLLVIALGHLQANGIVIGRLDTPDYYYNLDAPIEILAIIFIVGGVGLIGWGIWEARKKGTN